MSASSQDGMIDGSFQGVRVLVVEDHAPLARAVASLLTDTGAEVMGPVATSVEAEHLTMAGNPDLALVDLNLRGEEAVDLIQWLLERKLRIVVMSGFPMQPAALSFDTAYLQKPFSGDELFAVMRDRLLASA